MNHKVLGTTYAQPHLHLIEACKHGDRKAQFKLYQLYAKAMYNICVRILGNQAQAEDALQEAFVNAFHKLHMFEGRSSFGAWLKRIVINKCLSQLKRKQLIWEPIDENTLERVEQEPIREVELDGTQIHRAIKELPQGCRVIFTLYQLEGYDHKEISEILNISVSTSKSQYHRAKKLLQEKLVSLTLK